MQLTPEQSKAVLDSALEKFSAKIAQAQSNVSTEISSLTIDLNVARDRSNALKVSFPFTSLFVEDASDLSAYVRMIPESNDTGRDDVKLTLKDTMTFEFGTRAVFLYWPLQPLKKIVLKFFVTSKFTTGSLIQATQSQLPAITMGTITAPNDGLTIVQTASFSAGMSSLGGDTSFPNFLLNNFVGGFQNKLGFVPTGYNVTPLGFRILIKSAVSGLASAFVLRSYTDSNHTQGVQTHGSFATPTTVGVWDVSPSFSYNLPDSPIITTGRYYRIETGYNAGEAEIKVIFRAIPIVGA